MRTVNMAIKKTKFTVIIEKDETGMYIAEVPGLEGCYSQGKTVEEAMKNIREVIEMCLEEKEAKHGEFVGVKNIEV